MAALSAIELVMENLEGAFAHPSRMVFRNNMMMASLMAGLAFSNASLGLVHAMAHSLGGARNLAHGECNALLLEKVVAFNFPAASEKYSQLAAAMGVQAGAGDPSEIASALEDRIASLRRGLGITRRLRDLGVAAGDIPGLAAHASMDPCLATNPRDAAPAEIETLFEKIF